MFLRTEEVTLNPGQINGLGGRGVSSELEVEPEQLGGWGSG